MATNRLIQKGKVSVYANTLFDAVNDAQGQSGVLEVRDQMVEILHLMYADMDLSMALSNPDYTSQERYELAKAVFADCNESLREVLAVMAENGDADMLNRVFHAFEDVVGEKLDLCVVDVVTAVPLDDDLRTLIKKKAEADLGKAAMLSESIDTSILGGIIMSVNGMRIDASVISQLNRARHELKQTDGGES